jgi:adenine-specific DNA methylase
MTVREAYVLHRTACRNVSKGKGYTHRDKERFEEAQRVLKEFWAIHDSWYVTDEMVDEYDRQAA